MKCIIYKNGATIVFLQVPALVCDNCGEEYVNGDISSSILIKAREIIASGVKVDIREYQQSVA